MMRFEVDFDGTAFNFSRAVHEFFSDWGENEEFNGTWIELVYPDDDLRNIREDSAVVAAHLRGGRDGLEFTASITAEQTPDGKATLFVEAGDHDWQILSGCWTAFYEWLTRHHWIRQQPGSATTSDASATLDEHPPAGTEYDSAPSQTARFNESHYRTELRMKTDVEHFEAEMRRFAQTYVTSQREPGLRRIEVGEWHSWDGSAIDVTLAPIERDDGRGWGITLWRQSNHNPWLDMPDVMFSLWASDIGGDYPLLLKIAPFEKNSRPFIRALIGRCKQLWDAIPVETTNGSEQLESAATAGSTPVETNAQSGGVNTSGGTVAVSGDLVGRDKVTYDLHPYNPQAEIALEMCLLADKFRDEFRQIPPSGVSGNEAALLKGQSVYAVRKQTASETLEKLSKQSRRAKYLLHCGDQVEEKVAELCRVFNDYSISLESYLQQSRFVDEQLSLGIFVSKAIDEPRMQLIEELFRTGWQKYFNSVNESVDEMTNLLKKYTIQ